MARPRPLNCEQLESRLLRAAVGLPWTDPAHLTLSFAPDGTAIAGNSSSLFQDLGAQFPTTAAWQDDIVRAFQTWASVTNISVGLVSDNGAPFGTAGLMQGDPRFGDIRIGVRPDVPRGHGRHRAARPLHVGYALGRHDLEQLGQSQCWKSIRCGAP